MRQQWLLQDKMYRSNNLVPISEQRNQIMNWKHTQVYGIFPLILTSVIQKTQPWTFRIITALFTQDMQDLLFVKVRGLLIYTEDEQ